VPPELAEELCRREVFVIQHTSEWLPDDLHAPPFCTNAISLVPMLGSTARCTVSLSGRMLPTATLRAVLELRMSISTVAVFQCHCVRIPFCLCQAGYCRRAQSDMQR